MKSSDIRSIDHLSKLALEILSAFEPSVASCSIDRVIEPQDASGHSFKLIVSNVISTKPLLFSSFFLGNTRAGLKPPAVDFLFVQFNRLCSMFSTGVFRSNVSFRSGSITVKPVRTLRTSNGHSIVTKQNASWYVSEAVQGVRPEVSTPGGIALLGHFMLCYVMIL